MYYNYVVKYEVELNGRFIADINFWSGKATLSYEGMELPEGEGKNTFMLGNETCKIAGALFSGVYLCRGDEKVLLTKLYWYDYVAGILPFLVGLLGQMIGAVLGVACFFVCYKLMPYIKNYALRLAVCILIAAAVFIVIMILAMLFPSLFGLEASNA